MRGKQEHIWHMQMPTQRASSSHFPTLAVMVAVGVNKNILWMPREQHLLLHIYSLRMLLQHHFPAKFSPKNCYGYEGPHFPHRPNTPFNGNKTCRFSSFPRTYRLCKSQKENSNMIFQKIFGKSAFPAFAEFGSDGPESRRPLSKNPRVHYYVPVVMERWCWVLMIWTQMWRFISNFG